ncbi:MAG TPA: S-formylglutathione hydrolase [Thermohalobaculum sp.]|nr:S-formylglutathione hydrolase [Thermohalobaculum sp.]
METVSESRLHGGRQVVCRHDAVTTGCPMTFAVYLPPAADAGNVPCLWYLSGLTCTHENAMTKAGLQAHAARRGIALVFPDTSPRGGEVADDEAFDLGQGAGFYVDATEAPWAPNFAMRSYLVEELQKLVLARFPIERERQGATGHSMGGHGAITLALSEPDLYRSLSAFSPIANPTGSDWGRKQFAAYLGADESRWRACDASLLLQETGWDRGLLIDQGADDQFFDLLKPGALVAALVASRAEHVYRLHAGYDHSYDFVQSFGRDHVDWHADRL